MKPMASKLKTMRSRSASDFITGTNWKFEILLPDMEGGDEEVVNRGDAGGLQKQLGLRAALLAGDQHFGDGGRLRKGQLAVLLAHEVAAQRNEEEKAQAAAGQADEDGLHRMRIEVQDVERRQGEDGAGDHAAEAPPMPVMMTFSSTVERRLIDARQADGEDGDGDRRLHSLADFERRVGRSDAEDDAQQRAPEHRAPGDFRHVSAGGHQRHIELALFQRLIGVRGKRFRFEFGFRPGPSAWSPGSFTAAGIVKCQVKGECDRRSPAG